ncbi:hypothetical protein [Pelomonas cellulosilytica]|uniref:Integrase n=1 Tax=Pelomonas cellulosilytica TaxID=2906762 RepID=A0ABS8XTJ1_9BURK|nr:hypothetical protein [Pelomonas sp. P8]MCE4555035.1 hypothetical protein [Pelomonas sp. P8]
MKQSNRPDDPPYFHGPSTDGQASTTFTIARFEVIKPPSQLDGREGLHRFRKGCKIDVNTDLDAIRIWIEEASQTEATRRARRTLAERLLNWAYASRGKAVSSFEPTDFGAFIDFVASPGTSDLWITPRGGFRDSAGWRPFTGPLGPASMEASASHLSSLLTFLTKQKYADLYFAAGKRRAREGIADSSSITYQRDRREARTQSIPAAEWDWVVRWVDACERDNLDLTPKLVVELLYYGQLKLSEVSALSRNVLKLPLQAGGPWRAEFRTKNGAAIRDMRELRGPLTATIMKWFGDGITPAWEAFERGEPLLHLSADSLAGLVRKVFDGASSIAADAGEVASAQGLRTRSAMSLRHAMALHVQGELFDHGAAVMVLAQMTDLPVTGAEATEAALRRTTP